MPLLPLEPYVFPQDLFRRPRRDPDQAERWWVLHTRPRAEKTLARRLVARRSPFFLPLYHRRWQRKGRSFQSYLPLFPGYVFLYSDAPARQVALETNLVAYCLPVADQDRLYSDLFRVHQLVTLGDPLTPEERMGPGTPVVIIDGPLTGLTGTVLRRGKQLRFLVEVQLLQQGVSVEIESWMMRPLGEVPKTDPVAFEPCGWLGQ